MGIAARSHNVAAGAARDVAAAGRVGGQSNTNAGRVSGDRCEILRQISD